MKSVIMLLLAVTLVSARPQTFRPRPGPAAGPTAAPSQVTYARILRQEQDTQFDGSFNYAYETENGINGQASGVLKNPGREDEGISIEGSYSWTSPEGIPITITFIADEQGYRAQGDAIPTSPPVPEAIQRALDYIRSLPPPKENQQFK
uniref:Putative cuticle protein n=1 Tax=Panstrongylus lignarius TaxID=156445 RepID=A0A224XS48_9HEMI